MNGSDDRDGRGERGEPEAHDPRDDELLERRFDWALREVAGGERAPDVTEAVLARAAAGDVVHDAVEPHALSRARWLAFAAVFLLGVLTVLGVAWLRRAPDGDTDVGGKVSAQEGRPREVTRIEDIASLPVDLKAVELRNLEDDAIAALVVRCPDLEHLRVFASTAYRRADDGPARSITDASLPLIAKLTKLQILKLIGTSLVKGPGLKELTNLPALLSLELDRFDVPDEAVAFLDRLPALRDLSLFCPLLGHSGWETIGKCVGLRQLTVNSGCSVDATSLVPLRSLVQLESLCLFGVGMWPRDGAGAQIARQVGRMNAPWGGGVTADMFASWPKLRELDVRNAPDLEATIGATLRDRCPRLRWLRFDSCPRIDDDTIGAVLALPSLTKLELATCRSLTPDVVPKLAAAEHLATVDFGDLAWVTLAHVEQLMAAGKDVTFLHQRDAAFQSGVVELRQRYQHKFTHPNPGLVNSLADLEGLMWNTQTVELRGLGDRAAARLAQFPFLRKVSFVRDDDDELTAKGLRAIAALPKLEELALVNLLHLEPDALAALRACKLLRSLDVLNGTVSDAALQVLPELPALTTLSIRTVRTFGDEGAKAIGRCTGLRTVDLSGCEQLSRDAIAGLGALVDVETLRLAGLPHLDDSAMMGLQHLTKLRELVVANGRFTSMGLQALAEMRALTFLDLSGNAEIVLSALEHVPVGVQTLKLARCPGLGAGVAAKASDASKGKAVDPSNGDPQIDRYVQMLQEAMRARQLTLLRDRFPKLAELDVGENDWVTDDVLRTIAACASLQRLDLVRCIKLTNESFERIRGMQSLRWVRVTGTACASKEQIAQLRQERPDLEVVGFIW